MFARSGIAMSVAEPVKRLVVALVTILIACVGAFREGVEASDMTLVREGVACTPPGL